MYMPAKPGLIPAHAGKTRWRTNHEGSARAHPRSRGENRTTARFAPSAEGSSPLTRGKPVDGALKALCPRLIPAHAGKTPTGLAGMYMARAHPRSRGENIPSLSRRSSGSGSSPLTRGKLRQMVSDGKVSRLIPAHAGKTVASWRTRQAVRAHPRSRGENRELSVSDFMAAGSSPLTRGKRKGTFAALPHSGLIPAHAGKTVIPSDTTSGHPAHPRSRGENPLT